MTSPWFLWYGMHLGLSREEAQTIPLCDLLDLICIQQIKEEGFRYRQPMNDEQELKSILMLG